MSARSEGGDSEGEGKSFAAHGHCARGISLRSTPNSGNVPRSTIEEIILLSSLCLKRKNRMQLMLAYPWVFVGKNGGVAGTETERAVRCRRYARFGGSVGLGDGRICLSL